jgi:hypothetical protein
MELTTSMLNGQPYITGNAFGYFNRSTLTTAFPDFVGKYKAIPVFDPIEAPFGGHILEFENSADKTWFILKHVKHG